jgi:hypothetical protein
MFAARVTQIAGNQFQLYHSDTPGLVAVRELHQVFLGMSHKLPWSINSANRHSSNGKGTTSKYYFYMWRFGWVFYLIALIANVLSFFTCLLAPCSRLASGISGFLVANALFWFSLAASLMT